MAIVFLLCYCFMSPAVMLSIATMLIMPTVEPTPIIRPGLALEEDVEVISTPWRVMKPRY